MSNIEESRVTEAIDSLKLVLNVTPASIAETASFKGVGHHEICKSIKYWIEHLRLLFHVPISVEIIHGGNEYGIDLYLDLERGTRIKFAFQIKSHSDITKSGFSDSVHAQIEKSIRHGLDRIVFAFAADLTKQEKRINNVLGEIHTRNTIADYIIVVNAPELYTIYDVYLKKLHPVDYLNINTSNVIELASKFSKLLSNDNRKARVSISLEYMNRKNKDEGFQVTLRTNKGKDDASLIDRIETLQEGEKLVIPQGKISLDLFENREKVFSDISGELTLSKAPTIFYWSIYLLSTDGKTLSSMEEMPFHVKDSGDYYEFQLTDESNPIRFVIKASKIQDSKGFRTDLKLQLEDYRSDVVTLFEALKFLNSFGKAERIKYSINSHERESNLPSFRIDPINPIYYELIEKLAEIQRNTGTILKLPLDEFDARSELFQVNKILEGIQSGQINDLEFTSQFKLKKPAWLKILKDILDNKEFTINYQIPFYIFGKEFTLGPGLLLADKVESEGGIAETYKELLESSEDEIELKLKIKGSYQLDWYKNKRKKT